MASALSRFGCPTLSALQDRVLRRRRAFHELLCFLTVQVTEMFRDPAFFRAVRREVVPFLATYPSLRVWVAGCASGRRSTRWPSSSGRRGCSIARFIYATDVEPSALRRAREGIYAVSRVPAFSRAYLAAGGRGSLSQYYTAGYGAVVFDRSLRYRIVFAHHSLATDAVFAEVQLVTCRNVLIYFAAQLRERALDLFGDALVHGGFLGLGSRETLGSPAHRSAFQEIDREQRLYRRRDAHRERA